MATTFDPTAGRRAKADEPETAGRPDCPDDPGAIRLLVVGEPNLFREGVTEMCAVEDELTVLGQTDADEAARTAVERGRPDVVLLAVGRSQTEPDLVRELAAASPAPQVVVLGSDDDPFLIRQLIEAGAGAYVPRSATRAELFAVIRAVGNGRSDGADYVVMSVPRAAIVAPPTGAVGPLSVREAEVISLVAEGLTSAQVANTLYISRGTVKRHLTNIYAKLNASSRIQAINKIAAMGLLDRRSPGRPTVGRSA